MSTGNPQFNPKPSLPNISEKLKSEQEIQWGKKLAEVNELADRLGKGVDEKIKETVVAFLVHEFTTSSSCEGHMDEEGENQHGLPYPWVEVYAPEPEGWRDAKGERKKQLDREWSVENFTQQKKMMSFLAEFYKGRETSFDALLIFDRVGGFGGFRVQSFGAEMTAILTPEERKQKLKLYQKEMEDFTNFLKNKFLTNKNETENEIESDEETFKEYMESLQLRSEDLAKKILDVGSGSSQFGKWVNEHYKDSEVFSLDPRIESDKKTKTVKGIAEKIPFEDEAFDLVISSGAVPVMLYDELPEKGKERVHNGLFEMMRVTKPGGEIRLGSVIREVESDSQQWNLILNATLEELRQAYGVEIEEIHTPPDSYRYDEPLGEPKELFAKKYLIIIRKPLNPSMKSKPSI